MYSWLWVKLKICEYKFIMVSKRAHNKVKETPMQPYQTIVSIEWQPCFVHRCSKLPWSMPKNITTTWAGTVDWNLHFPLLKEFHWNCRVKQKATWQSNSKNHQCKYQVLCTYIYIYVYIYIYTVFAIAVYLESTYILIYIYTHEVPTDIMNLAVYLGSTNWQILWTNLINITLKVCSKWQQNTKHMKRQRKTLKNTGPHNVPLSY